MKVLIVENIKELGLLWQRALQRLGAEVVFVQTQSAAIRFLMDQSYDIIVLDLVLESGSALRSLILQIIKDRRRGCFL